jgi:hypothetical protein
MKIAERQGMAEAQEVAMQVPEPPAPSEPAAAPVVVEVPKQEVSEQATLSKADRKREQEIREGEELLRNLNGYARAGFKKRHPRHQRG